MIPYETARRLLQAALVDSFKEFTSFPLAPREVQANTWIVAKVEEVCNKLFEDGGSEAAKVRRPAPEEFDAAAYEVCITSEKGARHPYTARCKELPLVVVYEDKVSHAYASVVEMIQQLYNMACHHNTSFPYPGDEANKKVEESVCTWCQGRGFAPPRPGTLEVLTVCGCCEKGRELLQKLVKQPIAWVGV